jgi:ribosomal protein S18 acetylase RimI-like enzyme
MSSAPQSSFEPAPLRRATMAQVPALASLLARAFERDPVYQWLIADDAGRAARLHSMFELQLRRYSVELWETYTTPGLEGCAIWKPPGDYSLSLPEQLRALPAFAGILGWSRIPRSMKLMAHMDELHARLAPGPHVYLNVLGVEPSQQGRGIGRRLLEPMLVRCDAEGRDVYLETGNASNVPFYERNGFELREVSQRPPFPTFWAMFRAARSRA